MNKILKSWSVNNKRELITVIVKANRLNAGTESGDYCLISNDDKRVIESMTIARIDKTADLLIWGFVSLAKVINDEDLTSLFKFRDNQNVTLEDVFDYCYNLTVIKYDL